MSRGSPELPSLGAGLGGPATGSSGELPQLKQLLAHPSLISSPESHSSAALLPREADGEGDTPNSLCQKLIGGIACQRHVPPLRQLPGGGQDGPEVGVRILMLVGKEELRRWRGAEALGPLCVCDVDVWKGSWAGPGHGTRSGVRAAQRSASTCPDEGQHHGPLLSP